MKKVHYLDFSSKPSVVTIPYFVGLVLGQTHADGQFEGIIEQIEAQQEYLGKLTETLFEAGMIDSDWLRKNLDSHRNIIRVEDVEDSI